MIQEQKTFCRLCDIGCGIPVVVLAGGQSRRFGSNKAFAKINNKPMLDHILDVVRDSGSEAILSISDPVEFADYDYPKIFDPDPELRSPLNGLLASMRVLPGYFLALTVDSPGIVPEVLERFMQDAVGETGRPVVAGDDRRIYPFPGVYHADNIDEFEAAYCSGDYRLTELIASMNPIIIPLDEIRAIDPGLRSYVNINSPEDLADFAGSPAVSAR